MRTNKSEVKGMFARLVKAMNKRIDGGSRNGLALDYASCYGGYVIVEYTPDGGESHPFGCTRRTAREMYLSMYMTASALEQFNK